MDSKRAVIKQVKALEAQAESVKSIDERLDAIEAKQDELLKAINSLKETFANGKDKESAKKPAKAAKSDE